MSVEKSVPGSFESFDLMVVALESEDKGYESVQISVIDMSVEKLNLDFFDLFSMVVAMGLLRQLLSDSSEFTVTGELETEEDLSCR